MVIFPEERGYIPGRAGYIFRKRGRGYIPRGVILLEEHGSIPYRERGYITGRARLCCRKSAVIFFNENCGLPKLLG